MAPLLENIEGPQRGRVFPLEGKAAFDIGSAEGADVVLVDSDVEGSHLRIYREEDRFRILDLSGKGFLINGKRSLQADLEDGDVVAIGAVALRFSDVGGGQAASDGPHLEPAAEGMEHALLETIKGHDSGKVFDLVEREVHIVGRGVATDITLWDKRASRLHCRIDRCEEGYRLNDLNSSNGIWVNGEQVSSHVLRSGDRIKIGSTVLIYHE